MRRLALLLAFALLPVPAAGQVDSAPSEAPRPEVTLTRLPDDARPPVVDGVLDDAIWAQATLLGPLTQVEPIAGAPPAERTEVRLTYDARAFYIGVTCFDSDPSALRATQRERDARLDPDDRIELLIDPFLDRRNAFWFQIGPVGGKGDALITKNGSRFNKEWDGIWYGRSRITDEGWVAEFAIPVQTINFDADGSSWGFNIRRFIRRRNEVARWATPTPRIRFFSVADAGTLHGIEGLTQGLGLDVQPFFVARYERERATGANHRFGEPGLDLFYRVTPQSKVSVTLNTDFAETEVDDRQVNLTRFPLFFPEKRDFFLEDSGNFFFGPATGFGGERVVNPFFSRRIGIDDNGEEVPIRIGAKYTGQTEDYTFGFLDVHTDNFKLASKDAGTGIVTEENIRSRNLFVGRVTRNIGERSDAGLIFTHGNPTSTERSDTLGFDVNYRTTEYQGDKNLRVSGYALVADNEGEGHDELAYHVSASYPNDEVQLGASYTVVEENFDPALGFAPRPGVKRYEGQLEWNPRQYTHVRRYRFQAFPSIITDTGNHLETANLETVPFGIEWETGDRLDVRVTGRREVLDEDFDIQTGVTIPDGRHDWARYGVSYETADMRPVSVEVRAWTGGFFDGDRDDLEIGIDWRPHAGLVLGFEWERNDVRLPGGDFVVDIARLRVNVSPTPDVSWSNFVQYESVGDSLGLNSRLRWILEPGREAFFVVNQSWIANHRTIAPRTTELAAKLVYTLRF